MKLQYLAVIFIVIMMPIFLVTSYYIQLQIDTLNMQTSYDEKLLSATKEAIEAYEINTVEWNSTYSEVANSKRRDVMASINSFIDGLANKMGRGGASRSIISSYIPAIAFTGYDGYYIYAPTYVDIVKTNDEGLPVNNNGEQIKGSEMPISTGKEYKHVLRPFMRYAAIYRVGSKDITVNYTLDNYISIYGEINNKWESRSGYLIDTSKVGIGSNTINNVKYNSQTISPEYLYERIAYKASRDSDQYITNEYYNYVYNTEGQKTYYDPNYTDKNGVKGHFFTLSDKGLKSYLPYISDVNNSTDCKYTRISVPVQLSGEWTYKEIHQVLNKGVRYGDCYIDADKDGIFEQDINEHVNNPSIYGITGLTGLSQFKDYSSINYYVEAYSFTKWVTKNLDNVKTGDLLNDKGQVINQGQGDRIFNISNTNDPTPESSNYETSAYTIHKKEIIRKTIEDNLNQAIVNYGDMNKNSYDFKMPQFTAEEWELIENNVSIITFLQGVPIGNKYYNNYAIATSTNNREFVNPNEIYFTGNSDEYYHKVNCEKTNSSSLTGYRSVDFVVRRTQNQSEVNERYYYLHDHPGNTNGELACYYCLVNPSNYNKLTSGNIYNEYNKQYITALGRERYVQRKTIGK